MYQVYDVIYAGRTRQIGFRFEDIDYIIENSVMLNGSSVDAVNVYTKSKNEFTLAISFGKFQKELNEYFNNNK